MRIKYLLRVSIIALLAAAVLTGGAGAAPLVPSNSTDFVKSSGGQVPLSPSGGVNVVVVSLALPAGSWVLSAEAALVNFGPSDYTRCAMFKGSNQIAQTGTTTMVGNADLPGNWGPGVYVANIADIGKISGTTGFTVSLRCSHDHDTPSGNGPGYVDPGATIWAHKSTSLG